MAGCSLFYSKMLPLISFMLYSGGRLLECSLLRSHLAAFRIKSRLPHLVYVASWYLLSGSRFSRAEYIAGRVFSLASVSESIGSNRTWIWGVRPAFVEILLNILDSEGVSDKGGVELELRRVVPESVGVQSEVRRLVLRGKSESSEALAHYEFILNQL